MKIAVRLALILYIMMGISVQSVFAQYNIQHHPPQVAERGSTLGLTFSAPGINPSDVLDAILFYRIDQGIGYRQKNVPTNQADFKTSITIPENLGTSLEYYFSIRLKGGKAITYPQNKSLNGPVRVDIVEANAPQDTARTSQNSGIDYTILSPAPHEEVAYNDVVIALSLFYDKDLIDSSSKFRLYLDGKNITKQAAASDYFLSYTPDEVAPGGHRVVLKLAAKDSSQQIVAWDFSVSSGESISYTANGISRRPNNSLPTGHAEIKARSQTIAGNTADIYSGNFRFSGKTKNIRYTGYGLFTSQEDPRFQPQDRYGMALYAGDWFELQGGHIYPVLSPLTISGRRMLGVNSALHLFRSAINIQFLYGRLRRSISHRYTSVNRVIQPFSNGVADTTYTLNFWPDGVGTFQRDIIGGRLGFGRHKHFNFGINVLKIQDDTTSIRNINNFGDLVKYQPERARGLSATDRDRLNDDPSLLRVNGNPNPEGNLIGGADLALNFDDQRIQFKTDNALSLTNEDISRGPLTQERAARELGFGLDADVENTLDQLSWLIIINENLNSLPFEFDDTGKLSHFTFPRSTMASQSELSFDYLKNNLRLQYQWVGPNFNSLANSTIRKDIAGFTVNDRFRLFANRVYVTLGYDNLRDNLADFKEATTQTNSYRGNVSWYPIKASLPRISVGLQERTRDNDVALFNPFVPGGQSGAGVQNFKQGAGTALVAPRARMSNTLQLSSSISQNFNLFGINHNASFNYSRLNTTEDKYKYGDAESNSFSLRLTNRFSKIPLTTNIYFSLNHTKSSSGLTDIHIYGVNIGGSISALKNKLNLSANVAFTKNKSEILPLLVNDNSTPANGFDDYFEPAQTQITDESKSYIFAAEGKYKITPNHAFAITARLTNVTNTLGDNEIPNDQILQARYIFTF